MVESIFQILVIEPYYGGSHKHLIDCFREELGEDFTLLTLPAKKWHWRARVSALYLADIVPMEHNFKILFASSVLNLAELVALRPDLMPLRKIIYFHENQLVYPVQTVKERDFQFGYNQVLSCLVADDVIFNSNFNMSSFLQSIGAFFKIQPDFRPSNIQDKISRKCQVIHVPILRPPDFCTNPDSPERHGPLHIVWPHRWEHDKNPEMFFRVLFALKENGYSFIISVLGESHEEQPATFQDALQRLNNIFHWGYAQSKEEYYDVLHKCDVAVSTAKHEFFGVAMLEAASCFCLPLCPDGLSYREIFPQSQLYKNEDDLYRKLAHYCLYPRMPRDKCMSMDFSFNRYSIEETMPKFRNLMRPKE